MKIETYKCDRCGIDFDYLHSVVEHLEGITIKVGFYKSTFSGEVNSEDNSVTYRAAFREDAHLCVDCQQKTLMEAAKQFEKAEGV